MTKFSIIIATYNRAATFSKMFHSLLSQNICGDFDYELIMVDNNSSDDTKEKIHSYMGNFSGKLRYFFEPRQGKSFALNKGIESAKGDIFIFTDDDVIFDPHWLSSIWRCYKEHDCDGVGGRILPQLPRDTPNWVSNNLQLLQGPLGFYDRGSEMKQYKKDFYEFYGANYSFKRSVFEDCGLFRTDVGPGKEIQGEDTEFVNRAVNAGKMLYYCGQAVVRHVLVRRITINYIARWNMALARYRYIVDEKGKFDPALKTWAGVPRYLIRGIIITALSLPVKMFNRREFLKAWISFSLKLGTMAEIRKRQRCPPSA